MLGLISLMTLFHPIYDTPGERLRRAPTVAFSSKGTSDRRLVDEKMEPGYKALKPVLEDIFRPHDHVYANLEPTYEQLHPDAEALFRASGGRYPYDIRIEIHIDTRRGEVTIKDNCRGMGEETLRRVVRKVGESRKRGCTWVNGQFGFGVHAFRAAASPIAFRTKHQFDDHIVLRFNRQEKVSARKGQEKGKKRCQEPI